MPTATLERQQQTMVYNRLSFTLTRTERGWDIDHPRGTVGTGLFPGATEAEARIKARAVIRGAFPVGVKVVGPDISRPLRFGDLRIVPPAVSRPNFVHWDKEAVLP